MVYFILWCTGCRVEIHETSYIISFRVRVIVVKFPPPLILPYIKYVFHYFLGLDVPTAFDNPFSKITVNCNRFYNRVVIHKA